ncbi:MAG: YopX family protein [Candidatus Paceibacterota bacterium]
MREIKFRAWVDNKRMVDFESICNLYTVYGLFISSDIIPMQYTGLKDSTGKEIYEGDIITSNYHNDIYDYGFELTSFVEFRNGCFWLNVHKCELHYYNEFSIVVGNIYENPELLE